MPRSIECPAWDWRESRDFDELNHILQESKKLGKALESLSRSKWLLPGMHTQSELCLIHFNIQKLSVDLSVNVTVSPERKPDQAANLTSPPLSSESVLAGILNRIRCFSVL